jgi:hypothetical protein
MPKRGWVEENHLLTVAQGLARCRIAGEVHYGIPTPSYTRPHIVCWYRLLLGRRYFTISDPNSKLSVCA